MNNYAKDWSLGAPKVHLRVWSTWRPHFIFCQQQIWPRLLTCACASSSTRKEKFINLRTLQIFTSHLSTIHCVLLLAWYAAVTEVINTKRIYQLKIDWSLNGIGWLQKTLFFQILRLFRLRLSITKNERFIHFLVPLTVISKQHKQAQNVHMLASRAR